MIRTVEAKDYEKIAPLWNSVYKNDNYTAQEFAYMDSVFEPPCKFERFVSERNGKIVGATNYAQYAGQYHPQKFKINVFVRAAEREQGIGRELYGYLLERLEPFNPISLGALVKADDEAGMRFAQKRGFVESSRDWQSVLTLDSFDAATFSTRDFEDISLMSYADWGVTPERDHLFFEVFSDWRMDVPSSEPKTPLSYVQFRKQYLDAPDYFAEGVFFALKDNKPVGMTMFWRSESTSDLYTGLTAVQRDYRGQGIATALKLKALTFAKKRGASKVLTDNATTNVEMIAVNEKLGFVKDPAWITLRKVMP